MNDTSVQDRMATRSNRRTVWLAGAAVVASTASYGLAWRGGLWLLPVAAVLAVASLMNRPHDAPRERTAVLALIVVSLGLGVLAYVSSGGLTPAIRTAESTYSPGERVDLQIKGGLFGANYNLCAAALVEVDVGVDAAVPREPVICTAELRGVGPLLGNSQTVTLPDDVAPGRYRYADTVHVRGRPLDVRTPPFTVE